MLGLFENRRRTLIAVAVALCGIVFAVVHFKSDGGAESVPRYTVAPVTRGEIIQAVNTTGQLSPLVSVEVSTQVTSGLVTAVAVDFNSSVRKGQVLAKIDPATFEQRLRQANADLEAARASHRLAALNAGRMKDLRDQDLVTQREFDEAEAQLHQSQASLLTHKAAVENARVDLERCTITSPIDGIVIFKQIEVGKTVVSTLSAPTLFTIAQDLAKMRIIAPISEVDVGAVMPGQSVTFTVDAIPDRTFHGHLTQIRNPYTPSDRQQPQSAQQSPIATFDAVIEVDNSDLLLRPSLTANVSVIVKRRERVLHIPNGALRVTLPESVMARREANPNTALATVYRLTGEHRKASPQPVKVRLGISNSIVTEILDGLSEGEQVITGMADGFGREPQQHMGW